MKKTLYLIAVILFIPLVFGIKECQRINQMSDIPCIVLSSWKPETCSNYNLSIYNLNGTIFQNMTWQENPPVCAFNFSANLTGVYIYNSSVEDGVITVVGDDNMIFLLFIPLALCFLFIYWANSLKEEQEGLKWFMRLLSLIMVFGVYVGADIIIGMSPQYVGLRSIFNITILTWIFYTIFACVLVYFIFKIFMSFKNRGKDAYEEGELH